MKTVDTVKKSWLKRARTVFLLTKRKKHPIQWNAKTGSHIWCFLLEALLLELKFSASKKDVG